MLSRQNKTLDRCPGQMARPGAIGKPCGQGCATPGPAKRCTGHRCEQPAPLRHRQQLSDAGQLGRHAIAEVEAGALQRAGDNHVRLGEERGEVG
ncbi:MAG: hypothetical protein R3D28_13910 [Geminicoccaceae bacterium]